MSNDSHDHGNGHPTPPAFVRRIAERVDDQHNKHKTLKELVAANHMVTMHEIGQLATGFVGLSEQLKEMRELLAAALASVKPP